jgi:asparaginyl-tRNA synthetase
MAWKTVKDLLTGTVEEGQSVTVKGWVRTRRDSKAGLSFVAVHDGTCFDRSRWWPIDLPNYEDEILHLTTGCCGRRWTASS